MRGHTNLQKQHHKPDCSCHQHLSSWLLSHSTASPSSQCLTAANVRLVFPQETCPAHLPRSPAHSSWQIARKHGQEQTAATASRSHHCSDRSTLERHTINDRPAHSARMPLTN